MRMGSKGKIMYFSINSYLGLLGWEKVIENRKNRKKFTLLVKKRLKESRLKILTGKKFSHLTKI